MTTLTESIIELADRHTVLYHLNTGSGGAALPLSSEDEYADLYGHLAASPGGSDCAELNAAKSAVLLRRLRVAYRYNRYWNRYLGGAPDLSVLPELAWPAFLPIEASVGLWMDVRVDPAAGFRVSPIPRVLIYPFGWSAWISLRVTGAHSLEDLSSLVQSLSSQPSFVVGEDARRMSLNGVFRKISEGVQSDAFIGRKTRPKDAQELISVVTVLAKHGGSPSAGALSEEDRERMGRIVQPTGAPKRLKDERIYRFDGSTLDYLVIDDYGRFLWLERLLAPVGKNRQKLQCYHKNTFRSLVHGLHLQALLDEAVLERKVSDTLRDLAEAALGQLEAPRYRNATLVALGQSSRLKSTMEIASSRFGQPLQG